MQDGIRAPIAPLAHKPKRSARITDNIFFPREEFFT